MKILLDFRKIALTLISLSVLMMVLTCGREKPKQESVSSQKSKNWDRKRAELEYKLAQTELKIAKSEQIYLVLNLKHNQVQFKIKGVVVWDSPLQIAQPDSQKLQEFVTRFMGEEGRIMLPLRDKYLFSWQDKTPDSVLTIVGEVVRVDPDLLQRNIPSRFQLFWDYGLSIEVHTGITEESKSVVEGGLARFRHVLRSPFGNARIVLMMDPDDALTFYRAIQPNTPTILYP